MERAVIFLTVLALLSGQLGMLGALVGRHQARQQMEDKIEETSEPTSSKLETKHLTLTRSDRKSPGSSFVRIEKREFRYRGRLYDVVRSDWQGDTWHVWVVRDREEEKYLSALAQAMEAPFGTREARRSPESSLTFRPLGLVPSSRAPLPTPRFRVWCFGDFSPALHQGPHLEVPHPPPWDRSPSVA